MHAAPGDVQESRSSITNAAQFTVAYRLLRKDGFDHVVHAEKIADDHFKIFFARNGENNARLGIIASKKTLPGAADRNRIKRIIREAFRQHSIKDRKLDMVVMVGRADALEPGAQRNHLKTLFSRVEKRCAES